MIAFDPRDGVFYWTFYTTSVQLISLSVVKKD
jgi:hypothetical protein